MLTVRRQAQKLATEGAQESEQEREPEQDSSQAPRASPRVSCVSLSEAVLANHHETNTEVIINIYVFR